MEIYKRKGLELRVLYDMGSNRVEGTVYRGKEQVGIVVGEKIYIDTTCDDFERVAHLAEEMKTDLKDYCRMWNERKRDGRC